tara:strand:+ start:1574 stop:2731 length:1158 start_codon:yes stop_codon:yes gene_type:complete
MLTKNINFINFVKKVNNVKIKKDLKLLLKKDLEILKTLKPSYKYSYSKKFISKYKKYPNIRIIGIGGSILGMQSIYSFLKNKIKKKISFIDGINRNKIFSESKKQYLNLLISKSGNTLETISNINILIKKKDKNIFLTEYTQNYFKNLANKLKSDIVEHKNFIGGRYSVLSEVGMLPSELIGLEPKKFKQLNNLVNNKKFVNHLINNVSTTINFLKKKKFNSIILNYDESSENLFKWYQQLLAESLGKKGKGILPVISSMPKDNHSLMQLYLDGPRNNFFTFFYASGSFNFKIKNDNLFQSHSFLKNNTIDKIIYSQKKATEKVFDKKKIPYRSFEIIKRSEQTMGELFCFFILETILLGRAMKVNPFDQPSVELIKKETKKFLF